MFKEKKWIIFKNCINNEYGFLYEVVACVNVLAPLMMNGGTF